MLSIALVLASLTIAPPSPRVASAPAETHGKLTWFQGSYAEVLAQAKAQNKIVFIDLWREK